MFAKLDYPFLGKHLKKKSLGLGLRFGCVLFLGRSRSLCSLDLGVNVFHRPAPADLKDIALRTILKVFFL
jgi:hypothetical protein